MTDEYTKREAANEALLEDFGEHQAGFYSGLEIARSIIASLPAADVRPVVRGEWMEEINRTRSYKFVCSACYKTAYDPQPTRSVGWVKRCRYAFCPNCGAVMKEAE